MPGSMKAKVRNMETINVAINQDSVDISQNLVNDKFSLDLKGVA